MDPITLIVAALAAGAAAALKPTAEQAIKDAYAGIKRMIQDRYADTRLDRLEQRPQSTAQQQALAEDLQDAGAAADADLLALAKHLVDALAASEQARQVAQAIGVDLTRIKAASLSISDVTATGPGVRVDQGDFSGDIDIRNVKAGSGAGKPDPNA